MAQSYKKIIIKSSNWIGDTIMSTPAINCLRENFPNAQIDVICRPWVKEVLKNNPDINNIFIEEKGIIKNYPLITQIRTAKYDLGVLFPNSFSSALMLWLAGVKNILGYNRDGRGLLLSKKIKPTKEILEQHQVEYYYNLVKQICEKDVPKKLILNLENESKLFIDDLLKQKGINENDFVVGINPGAFAGSAKRWYPERFAKVGDYMVEKHNAKIILVGTDKEKPLADKVEEFSQFKNNYFNFAGTLNLQQHLCLLNKLKLFYTNDSGSMHMASALDIPIVAIFGGTDWKVTYPYNKNSVMIRKNTECAPCLLDECPTDHRCMKNITPEDVINATEDFLKIL